MELHFTDLQGPKFCIQELCDTPSKTENFTDVCHAPPSMRLSNVVPPLFNLPSPSSYGTPYTLWIPSLRCVFAFYCCWCYCFCNTSSICNLGSIFSATLDFVLSSCFCWMRNVQGLFWWLNFLICMFLLVAVVLYYSWRLV